MKNIAIKQKSINKKTIYKLLSSINIFNWYDMV